MCTCITHLTKDGNIILARNFDSFDAGTQHHIFLLPRKYQWLNAIDNQSFTTKYAILGLASLNGMTQPYPIYADGLNEKGFVCASLTYDNIANETTTPDKVNLDSSNFPLWALSQFATTSELLENIPTLNLLTQSTGFHYALSDATGHSVVIEKSGSTIMAYENPLGVLTNNPAFPVHLMNLTDYLIAGTEALNSPLSSPILPHPLPGDDSSTSRFLRASLLQKSSNSSNDEIAGVSNCFQILQNCAIWNDSNQYTHFTTAMCTQSGKYYYRSYCNEQISCLRLRNEHLNGSDMKIFRIPEEQMVRHLNE